MKQLPGSTGALRAGPGTVIEGRELDGYELFGGRVLPVEDPAERPVFRNITLRGCAVRDCFFEGALLEDVLIDGLTAPQDPHQRVLACAFHRVALRGRISNVTLLPDLDPWHAGLQPRYRNELKLERGRFSKARHQAASSSVDTLEDFLALPLERQQALILHSLSAILIHPAGRGVRKFDPSLIEPVWR